MTPTKKKMAKVETEMREAALRCGQGFTFGQADYVAESLMSMAIVFRIIMIVLAIPVLLLGMALGWWLS